MKIRSKRFLNVLFGLVLALMLCGTALADWLPDWGEFSYVYYDSGTMREGTFNGEYFDVHPWVNSWGGSSESWYVVSADGETPIFERINVTGTVNLILCDGAQLTAPQGIQVNAGATLNIYAQSAGTGTLIATGVEVGTAGIGCGNFDDQVGMVVIHGGNVIATGAPQAAGIGGGDGGDGGNVTIYGGTVNATGGGNAMGIGRGNGGGSDGELTLGTGIILFSKNSEPEDWHEPMSYIHVRRRSMMAVPMPIVTGASLDLNGTIQMNIRVKLPAPSIVEDYQFTSGDEPVVSGDEPVVSGDFDAENWEMYGGDYIFTCPVSPKNIADSFTLMLRNSAEDVIPMRTATNDYDYGYPYSVMKYINAVNAQGEDYDDLKALTRALQNYGHYAAEAFGVVENMADSVDDLASDMAAVNAASLAKYQYNWSGDIDGLQFVGMTLELGSETALYLGFIKENSENPVTAEGVAGSAEGDASVSATNPVSVVTENIPSVLTDAGCNCAVKIDDIRARQLNNTCTVKVSYNGNQINFSKLCALSYAQQVLSADSGTYADSLKNVVKALRVYNMAAEAYFAQ